MLPFVGSLWEDAMEKVAAAVSEVLREAMDGIYAEIGRLLKQDRDRFDEERKRRFYQNREDFERKVMAVVMVNFERRIKTFRAANTRCFVVGKVGWKEGEKGFQWREIAHTFEQAINLKQPDEQVRSGQILIERYPRVKAKRNKQPPIDATQQQP